MILNLHPDLPLTLKEGAIYLLKTNTVDVYKEIEDKKNTCFINMPIKEAFKVTPYFGKISKDEINSIKSYLFEEFQLKIRDDDMLGKLIISIFKLIRTYKMLVIELSGFSYGSIDFLKQIMKSNLLKNPNRIILLVLRKKPEISDFDISVL